MKISQGIVNSIVADLKRHTELKTDAEREIYILGKYKELYDEYPFLLKKLAKIYDNEEQLTMLLLLVAGKEQIDEGQSQEKVESKLRDIMATKYNLPNPDNKD